MFLSFTLHLFLPWLLLQAIYSTRTNAYLQRYLHNAQSFTLFFTVLLLASTKP